MRPTRPSMILATLATSVAALGATLVAPPGIASAEENAQETILRLQSDGFRVNVDRFGAAPTKECVVTDIRNPQTRTRFVRDYYGSRDEDGRRRSRLVEVVVSKTISVSLDCT